MPRAGLLQRHPVKAIFLLVTLIILFAEGVLRITFAMKHYPVGQLTPSWLPFKSVDSLEIWDSFLTDENGIYVANREYWVQRGWEINSEGFRGGEFIPDTLDDSSLTILFIGDSFTWGAKAIPQDSCFVDLLDRDDSLKCYNGGMPGTDPAQYLEVAKMYVPRLRPSCTVVVFNLANDLMDTVRTIIPTRNLYFQTNAGWLPVDYKGRHFESAKEAYSYAKNKFLPQSWWEQVFLKTAIGTALLTFPLRMEEYADWRSKRRSNVANNYLHQIREVCKQNNSEFFVFIIPYDGDLTEEFHKAPFHYIVRKYPAMMKGLDDCAHVFPLRPEHLHPQPDGHLNNSGHLFAARFIRERIRETIPGKE